MTDHTSEQNRAPRPFTEECAFVQDNLEAEALDILEPADHARVQRHLQVCGRCRRSVAAMREVASMLPLVSPPATPSARVKTRVLERIAAEPAPIIHRFPENPWAAKETPAPEPTPSPSSPDTSGDAPSPWRVWMMSAIVAPLTIALIVLGAWTSRLQHDLDDARTGINDSAAAIETATGDGGLRLYAMEPSCPECDDTPATGHLGGDPNQNVGILVAWNLTPGERHEVWCENRDGTVIRVSDLDVAQTGQVLQTVNFPDPIGGYSTIYVTSTDGTEEMRVALHEDTGPDDSTPSTDGTLAD